MDYNPHRVSDGKITEGLLALARHYAVKPPVEVLSAEGYMMTLFEKEGGTVLHMLAADYDTDIDHHLDEIRFHRSRVNFVNKADPIGISREVQVKADVAPKVFTPFNAEESCVVREADGYRITLPEKTAYAILYFEK